MPYPIRLHPIRTLEALKVIVNILIGTAILGNLIFIFKVTHIPLEFPPRKPSSDAPLSILYMADFRDRCHSPSPLTIREHAAAQKVSPFARSSSRPYVLTMQGGAANSSTYPNLDEIRQHTFGSPSLPLGVLATDPEKALALDRATF